jgi:hypothetical protein
MTKTKIQHVDPTNAASELKELIQQTNTFYRRLSGRVPKRVLKPLIKAEQSLLTMKIRLQDHIHDLEVEEDGRDA